MLTKNTPKLLAGLVAISSTLTFPLYAVDIISDELITDFTLTTPWEGCQDKEIEIDLSNLEASGCSYLTTPVIPENIYKLTCGGTIVSYSSLTLAFLDEFDNTLDTKTTKITVSESGVYSVIGTSPEATTAAAIALFGDIGSGFQDCTLINITPPPEPTKGSIMGSSWFDENADSTLQATESKIAGTPVTLIFNGIALQSTTTDTTGNYNFGNLDIDACYTVSFGISDTSLKRGEPGGENAADATGKTTAICLSEASPNITDINAAYVATPPVAIQPEYAICGVAWLDANKNGIYDGTDSVLANVDVKVVDTTTNKSTAIKTNTRGLYAFSQLEEGNFVVQFTAPDKHYPTTFAGQPLEGSSYIGSDNKTPTISLPANSNTPTNSACTIDNVNAGYIGTPAALPQTIANDDSAKHPEGEDFFVDVLANDSACNGAVSEVNLLGHNVPGIVLFNAASQELSVSGTTEEGTYKIEYGLRGTCGSYDTATVTVEITPVTVGIPPTAPPPPICRIETGGNSHNGGVDVFNVDENAYAQAYNLYDRDRVLVRTVLSSDYTDKLIIEPQNHGFNDAWLGDWQIEWNGDQYGFDQTSIYYISSVTNNEESELTECVRTPTSPIALDLTGQGRVERINGDFVVDIDGDGVSEAVTQWFAPSAGILVTGNPVGQISGKYLFGNVSGIHADGFSELATLDKDKDGTLQEDELQGLSIWNDLNSDTIVDRGEISSLESHKIVSLAVNHYKYMARAIKSDGTSILMEDVWFPIARMAGLSK